MSPVSYPAFAWFDIREPTLRQHEEAMERGSKELLKTLWKQHPKVMRERTGQMVGTA